MSHARRGGGKESPPPPGGRGGRFGINLTPGGAMEVWPSLGGCLIVVVVVVPAGDLAASRDPDLLVGRDVLEGAVEPLCPKRVTREERVQGERHNAPALGALLVHHVELVADYLVELL